MAAVPTDEGIRHTSALHHCTGIYDFNIVALLVGSVACKVSYTDHEKGMRKYPEKPNKNKENGNWP